MKSVHQCCACTDMTFLVAADCRHPDPRLPAAQRYQLHHLLCSSAVASIGAGLTGTYGALLSSVVIDAIEMAGTFIGLGTVDKYASMTQLMCRYVPPLCAAVTCEVLYACKAGA